jgi:hypothetical protein
MNSFNFHGPLMVSATTARELSPDSVLVKALNLQFAKANWYGIDLSTTAAVLENLQKCNLQDNFVEILLFAFQRLKETLTVSSYISNNLRNDILGALQLYISSPSTTFNQELSMEAQHMIEIAQDIDPEFAAKLEQMYFSPNPANDQAEV